HPARPLPPARRLRPHARARRPGSLIMHRSSRWWWLVGLAIAALVVVVLAPLASPDPDGLERVAEDRGFIDRAQDALYEILPDYSIPGIDDPFLSTVLAGLIGVAVVFALMVGLGRLLARRRAPGERH
ncbi:MAG: PDGLE domain-containing protein, partial [Chloroflexi bacterium]|nr:PDGLE domain-containing protein [Chloroflexota bacterium]